MSFWKKIFGASTHQDRAKTATDTAFLRAVERGDNKNAQVALAAGANPAVCDKNGAPALFLAISKNCVELADVLLGAGASPNTNKHGISALHLAVLRDNATIVESLLKRSALLEAKLPAEGQTPLHLAVHQRKLNALKTLLKHKPNLDALDAKKWSPLQIAVVGDDNPEAAKLLLEAGANKEGCVRGGFGVPALHIATTRNNAQIVALLLRAGADVNSVESENQETPLIGACMTNSAAALSELLKAKPDINRRGKGLTTGVHAAVIMGHASIIRQLANAGANINLQCEGGATALHLAVYSNKVDCVEALLASGADLKILDDGGKTPALAAVRNKHETLAKRLVEHELRSNRSLRDGTR